MKPTIVLCAAFLTLAWAAVWGQGGAPTDPQIAAIVVTANQVDVDAGKLAESKTQSGDVKAFAQRMVIDHTGVIKSAKELVQKLHVTPEPNATSESFQKSGDENLAALRMRTSRRCWSKCARRSRRTWSTRARFRPSWPRAAEAC